MKVPEDPKPVLAGMSATLTSSMGGTDRVETEGFTDDRMLYLIDLCTCLRLAYLRSSRL